MKNIIEINNLTVSYNIKKTPKIDGVFLHKIKKNILKDKYDLNIYFVGEKMMCNVNKKYRNKDYVTDILSFPFLDDDFGEIYICLSKVKSKSKNFNTTTENYLNYLFVHGMLHLTGLDHSEQMDKLERKYTKKLNIFYPY